MVVVPSSNFGGTIVSTSPLKTGVFDCGFPLASSDTTFSVVVFPNTVGVYVAVTGVPFSSTRLTVTPLAFPTKFASGVKVTLPLLSIV